MTKASQSIAISDHPNDERRLFRETMRQLASGVSIIASGRDNEWTGITATSVSSLSAEPPRLLVCVNRSSSLAPFIQRHWNYSVNFLASEQHAIAERFAGRGGIQGHQRFQTGNWKVSSSGTPVLQDALSSIDCKPEEIIERHSHLIIIGRPVEIVTRDGPNALIYWRGDFTNTASPELEVTRG